MKTVENYLRHAETCDRLARYAVSDEQRQMILQMADTWRMLADTRRRIILKNGPAASPELVTSPEKERPASG